MGHERILVVEDEPDLRQVVKYHLDQAGFRVACVGSGDEALEHVARQVPDLVILDLMLPGIDGLDVCRSLRADPRSVDIRILMLTARGDESDIVTGLELGANDYMTKPFSLKEMVARVRALLRRREPATSDAAPLTLGGIAIHPGRYQVTVDGELVDLTSTEFRLLHFLARRPGWVFTRGQIVQGVRGEGYPVTERSVDVQIFGLRKKLGRAEDNIETVRGVGYRFKE
jgi:two-component system alkaline phosphatase synthesis response regulator PhoP